MHATIVKMFNLFHKNEAVISAERKFLFGNVMIKIYKNIWACEQKQ